MTEQSPTSWALFRQSAEDLAGKLAEVGGQPEAQQMAREARDLVALFTSWGVTRPANDVRIAAIHQLFDLNRRAMDFLSKQGRTSPNRGTVPPSIRGKPTR